MLSHRTIAGLTILFALPTAPRAAASPIPQHERWNAAGLNRIEKFGTSVAMLGDVNLDGVPDFAVGAPVVDDGGGNSGLVRIFSGATGNQIREITHADVASFGSSVTSAGDFDGDGHNDVLVGAPGVNSISNSGAVYVVSSLGGTVLQTFTGGIPNAGYGSSIANLGDIDADGSADFLIGAPDHKSTVPYGFGLIEVRSGATGAVIHSLLGFAASTRLGELVCATGDFDGDGLSDLATVEYEGLTTISLRVKVRSSATFAILVNDLLTPPSDAIKNPSMASVGDLDGDGRSDLLVAASSDALFGLWGSAKAWGSATAASVFTLVDSKGGLGKSCCGVGDLDGDGLDDFAISRPFAPGGTVSGGTIDIFAADDQAILSSITVKNFDAGASLAGGTDYDADGVGDLLVGAPPLVLGVSGGKAQLYSTATAALLRDKNGRDDRALLNCGSCFFDDIDGDGIAELLAGVSPTTLPVDARELAVLAGGDGHEIKRFQSTGRDFGGALALAPDMNGDGVSDFVVASLNANSAVELHSGADGSLIRAFTDARTSIGYGTSLVVGVQPSGAVHLLIGSPLADTPRTDIGEVLIVDLATGVTIATATGNLVSERYGSAAAFAGDVNNDGTGDWAVAAPRNNKNATEAGRVAVINGKTGTQIKNILGTVANDRLGTAIAAIDDIDADGVPDLVVGVPFAGANDTGELRVYSLKTLSLLRTLTGAVNAANLGTAVAAVDDANGDGFAEVMGSWVSRDRADLMNCATGLLLRPLLPSLAAERLLVAPAWLAAKNGGGDGPLLAIAAPNDGTGGITAGAIALLELDDFYLQIAPDSAAAGVKVFAYTRGGPPASATVLLLEEVNGTPVSVTLDAAVLDVSGGRSVGDTIPVGLSGTVWSIRSYAIGFSGGMVDSQLETLTFE